MEQKNVKIKGDYSIVVTAKSPVLVKEGVFEEGVPVEQINESIVFSEDLVLEHAVTMALGLKNILPSDSYVHVVRTEDIADFDRFYVSKFMF